ncbi:Virulence protein RhuM family protein [Fibrobacter sp. UWCM]|uniref:virulence RhuM family protein n=1 Tax=Fibrobacter sp. UWCM TaxID=1896208 RepID=UPI0009162027|nr:RhuM family protein [Fibrobacter sp. UWCM]SHH09152.1 Virulence protein RhuM family protein [Fibrobacter sp. UWCM]
MKGMTKVETPAGGENKGEIVLYQPEGEVRLEVRVENETVWLTQAQMAELFDVQRQAITKHIKNIIETHELEETATSSILELVQKEGRRLVKRPVTLYNLDMIISVGFRVNTQRGIRFRRWANQVLKDYMLKGYAVRQRKIATDLQIVDRLHEQRQMIENQGAEIADVRKSVAEQDSRLSAVEQRIDFFVKASQTPTSGILTTGTRFDGLVLIADLVKSAKRSVVFIDPFATIEVLKFAAMRAKGVQAVVYSARITPEFKEAVALHNKQYPGLEPKTMRTIHDRFLLVDDKVYHFGASFKDMGNEMTAFSVLDFITPAEVIEKIQESMKRPPT